MFLGRSSRLSLPVPESDLVQWFVGNAHLFQEEIHSFNISKVRITLN
jgi:hypothetical protein